MYLSGGAIKYPHRKLVKNDVRLVSYINCKEKTRLTSCDHYIVEQPEKEGK